MMFLIGFISLVLGLIGLDLQVMEAMGLSRNVLGLVIKLLMVFGGLVVFYIARTDFFNQE